MKKMLSIILSLTFITLFPSCSKKHDTSFDNKETFIDTAASTTTNQIDNIVKETTTTEITTEKTYSPIKINKNDILNKINTSAQQDHVKIMRYILYLLKLQEFSFDKFLQLFCYS